MHFTKCKPAAAFQYIMLFNILRLISPRASNTRRPTFILKQTINSASKSHDTGVSYFLRKLTTFTMLFRIPVFLKRKGVLIMEFMGSLLLLLLVSERVCCLVGQHQRCHLMGSAKLADFLHGYSVFIRMLVLCLVRTILNVSP